MNVFSNLIKNFKYLLTHDLRKVFSEQEYKNALYIEDYCKYELEENKKLKENSISIMDYEETIDTLLMNPKSFCRFGDGEINLIKGESISFQKYDSNLARLLLEILENNTSNLYVGINYNYFHSTKLLNEYNRKFYISKAKIYRDFLLEHCCRNRKYIAAGFNQLYITHDKYDFDSYFKKIKKLFLGRKLAIFAGTGILDKLDFDVFEECKSKTVIAEPSIDAFSKYSEILEKAKSFSKDYTLCFILGPASKAIVYELSKEGYLAWDIGHLAKDYDYYMKKGKKSSKEMINFFKPD